VPTRLLRYVVKPLVFVAALGPFGWLVWAAFHNALGANPLEAVTHETGDWTLRFLLLTLAVTPARALSGWNSLIRFRRMLGLFAFFYGSLHLMTYLWFDQAFSWSAIVRDIPKRPFITVGFLAFVSMVPLAATSTAGMIRRLGGRRWRALHRLVYAAALAGVIHYWWLVKADVRLPQMYAVLLCALLVLRVGVAVAKRRPLPARAAAPFRPGRSATSPLPPATST
jgi:sulfoxide reductase heme-binding subunit YedZ